ncbi:MULTISPECIES: PTS sugar transporter subunit IIA [Terrabacteria group]|uniref:PTS sugar transporter subunit IIA n=1 Tax=Bacillati TaxID=1783272 RepID=UPI001939B9AB|nr:MULTISPECIES: PTS sugar transporter subunit IIA [Terrabacteria group]MBW9213063.1 PTS sugar transporter subunit IIA [Trueperella sp. zg.1013]QRG87438.1 PTS sugar transporter subunit IIA [Bulleidia sp. zg-1006]
MLLEQIYNNHLTSYHEKFDDWKEALDACGKTLIEQGYIDHRYVEAIIKCVEEFGPYIVLIKDVAMPHSTVQAEGVYKTAIGFMKVHEPVVFDENDDEKQARLFFTLAATNNEEHLNNMMQLSELLQNEQLVADLLTVNDDCDLLKIIEKYK